MSDFKEIYFTRCVLCAVIDQSYKDALNFTRYKNSYKQEEADRARMEALSWLHSDEFEQWCGALGLDNESILEQLNKKYAVQKMRRRDEGCNVREGGNNDVPEKAVSGVSGEGGDKGGCCGGSEVGVVEQGSQAEAEAEKES